MNRFLILSLILTYTTAKVHRPDNNDDRYYDYSDVNNVTGKNNTSKERNPILVALRDLEQHITNSDEDTLKNEFNNIIEKLDDEDNNVENGYRRGSWSRLRNGLLTNPFAQTEVTIQGNIQKRKKPEFINKNAGRRIIEWFNNLFHKIQNSQLTTTPKIIASTTQTTIKPKATRSEDDLTTLMNKLIVSLEDVNKNISRLLNISDNLLNKKKCDSYLLINLPVAVKNIKRHNNISSLTRSKRHAVNNTVERNESKALNRTNTFEMNGLNKTKDIEKLIPTRRNLNSYVNNDIKIKLLKYLSDSFDEIKDKMIPLTKIKHDYADDNVFKIGYVVANMDTLKANLSKLRMDMERHQRFWDDNKILDLLDKLKVANNVVSNLLDSLKYVSYAEKSRY